MLSETLQAWLGAWAPIHCSCNTHYCGNGNGLDENCIGDRIRTGPTFISAQEALSSNPRQETLEETLDTISEKERESLDLLRQKQLQHIAALHHSGLQAAEEVIIQQVSCHEAPSAPPSFLGPRVNIFGKLLESDKRKSGPDDGISEEVLDDITDTFFHHREALFEMEAETNTCHLQMDFEAFEVELRRGRDKILGLIITPDFGPNYLYIEDIWENSAVSDWNDSHGPDMQIQIGNVITAVNGVSSRAQDMLGVIRSMPTEAIIRLRIEDPGNYDDGGTTREWIR